jgi:hypothetical protein
MHEDILAVLGGDESITLLVTEPLHNSFCHSLLPPFLEIIVNPVRNPVHFYLSARISNGVIMTQIKNRKVRFLILAA